MTSGAVRGATLPADDLLFDVPDGLLRILERDLRTAGIPKRDDRGRTLDVHALRHTFGSFLSAAGVAPRVAQSAMRHSRIDLTMNVYTDPQVLDIAGAVGRLPRLNRTDPNHSAAATGTDGRLTDKPPDGSRPFAPAFAPDEYKLVQTDAISCNPYTSSAAADRHSTAHEKARKLQGKACDFRAFFSVGTTGFEPATS